MLTCTLNGIKNANLMIFQIDLDWEFMGLKYQNAARNIIMGFFVGIEWEIGNCPGSRDIFLHSHCLNIPTVGWMHKPKKHV